MAAAGLRPFATYTDRRGKLGTPIRHVAYWMIGQKSALNAHNAIKAAFDAAGVKDVKLRVGDCGAVRFTTVIAK